MNPTFVLTAILDVLDLEEGGRETGLRFACVQTGDFFDMPIDQSQLEQVIGAVSEMQAKLADAPPPATGQNPPAEPPPSDPSLAGRGAVDMQPPLEHEEDPDMEPDEEDPIVLRTPAFRSPSPADEGEL